MSAPQLCKFHGSDFAPLHVVNAAETLCSYYATNLPQPCNDFEPQPAQSATTTYSVALIKPDHATLIGWRILPLVARLKWKLWIRFRVGQFDQKP